MKRKDLVPPPAPAGTPPTRTKPVCDTMERLGTLPFVSQPGESWVYGYNTDVLGCIVEKVSGTPLDAYIRDHITAPLGMKDTQFFLPPAQKDRFAAVYAQRRGRKVRAGAGRRDAARARTSTGRAGISPAAQDCFRRRATTRASSRRMRRGGSLDGTRILSPLSVKLMSTNQVGALHSTTGLGFGLGFETVDRFGANGMSSEGAFGWGGAYGSLYRVDPEARLVMSLMIQLIPNATDIREVFPTLVYQALPDERLVKGPSDSHSGRDVCASNCNAPLDDDSVSVDPVTTTLLSPLRIAV